MCLAAQRSFERRNVFLNEISFLSIYNYVCIFHLLLYNYINQGERLFVREQCLNWLQETAYKLCFRMTT